MTSITQEKSALSQGRSDAAACRKYNLTVPQLVCLRQLVLSGPSMPGNLAAKVFLSQATVTGILDRLEARDLVKRERSSPDRRRVTVSLTDSGQRLVRGMPWPLQERFDGFAKTRSPAAETRRIPDVTPLSS